MSSRHLLALAGFAATVFVAAPSAQPSAQQITNFDRNRAVIMLRQVRADLQDNYYDPSFHGIDIEATFREAEGRIRQARSVSETTAIIVDAVMRLDDSHTVFYPPARIGRVLHGWHAMVIGDAAFIDGVRPGSDAAAKGIGVGDQLVGWNRFAPDRDNFWQIRYLYTYVRPQITHRLSLRKPDGTENTIDVQADVENRPGGGLDELIRELEGPTTGVARDPIAAVGDVMVWRMRRFGDADLVDAAMKKARDYKALVLDLRGNPGGRVATEEALVSRLFDRDVTIGTVKERKGDQPRVAAGRKDAFTGRVAVLVDSTSASASEVVARVLQIQKRAVVVGDRTAGSVMTARIFRHGVGMDSVALYAVGVTVGDLRMSDGGALEHVGVTPDESVLPSAADLAAGRDPALARAVTLLGGSLTADEAGRLYRAAGQR